MLGIVFLAITPLQSSPPPPPLQGQVAFCTDSSYVDGGAAGSARRGKVRGWKNAKGAVVPNTALWEALIEELDMQGRVVEWVKVLSHVGIEGRVEADRLANQVMSLARFIQKTNFAVLKKTNYGVPSPQKKGKVDSEGDFPRSPFSSRNKSVSLLNSLCLVPLSDRVSYSSSECGSEATEPDERGHWSSDSDSTAPTGSEYPSSC